ncbi:MAG: hypothetical protein ABT03_11470 [Comamonas sp. SCN 67-35]|nr:MAG: hypothetical protein ABT03_11470 [Comamonas sp. SCN 67-35]
MIFVAFGFFLPPIATNRAFQQAFEGSNPPPLRNQAYLGFLHVPGWYAVEVHEAGLEQRSGDGFQRRVDLAQIVDAVVERAQDFGDGVLFFDLRCFNHQRFNHALRECIACGTRRRKRQELRLH